MNGYRLLSLIGIFWLFTAGCAEVYEEQHQICRCGLSQYDGEKNMSEYSSENTSDHCALFVKAIAGQWYGNISGEMLRLNFESDGSYSLSAKRDDRWIRTEHGTYWIDYLHVRGLMRTTLNMKKTDAEEYPVYIFVQDGSLYFEEHIGDLDILEFTREPL